jgi:hypothetical protein
MPLVPANNQADDESKGACGEHGPAKVHMPVKIQKSRRNTETEEAADAYSPDDRIEKRSNSPTGLPPSELSFIHRDKGHGAKQATCHRQLPSVSRETGFKLHPNRRGGEDFGGFVD